MNVYSGPDVRPTPHDQLCLQSQSGQAGIQPAPEVLVLAKYEQIGTKNAFWPLLDTELPHERNCSLGRKTLYAIYFLNSVMPHLCESNVLTRLLSNT